MRNFFLTFFIIVPWALFAQKAKINNILNQPHQEIEAYDTLRFGRYQSPFYLNFGEAAILNPSDYDSIRALGKVRVEYVYSQFSKSFPGQRRLDEERFAALAKMAPDLFEDPSVSWEIVRQTRGKSREEAEGLFHGFVVTYQPPLSPKRQKEIEDRLAKELDCVKKRPPADAPQFPGGEDSLRAWLIENIPLPTVSETGGDRGKKQYMLQFLIDTATGTLTKATLPKGIHEGYKKRLVAALGEMPRWLPGNPNIRFMLMLSFEPDKASGRRTLNPQPLRGIDPIRCKDKDVEDGEPIITEVLTRNAQWKNILMVEDVTGSMLPYVAELLVWNALSVNAQKVRHVVLFNDGDSKSNDEKVIGKTGGIYHVNSRKITVLEETMVRAMVAGNGGDTPENDIEAIIEGLKACPSCDEVVLIADNNATPRDLELLSQIDKPVRVILCGVKYSVNPAHLYIAWKTKGSLHTIDRDINELAAMKEGDVIRVMDIPFRIKDGKFTRLSEE
ncbi:MAG: hypothetical protein ACK4NS_12610 [Saprospiraceae bacterium]